MAKVLLIDLYGTIIDQGLNQSPVKQVKKKFGITDDFQTYIKKFEDLFMTAEHDSLREAFEKVADAFGLSPDEAVFEDLVGMWNTNALLSELYDDTTLVLNELAQAGHTLVLVANVDRFTWNQLETKFDISEYFDYEYLSFESGKLKTALENLEMILEEVGVEKEDVLYLGDSMKSDIHPANEFGLETVLVDRRDTRNHKPKITTLKDVFKYV